MRISRLALIAAIVCAGWSGACGETFEQRLAAGRAAARSELGRAYDMSLGAALQDIMPRCAPPGAAGKTGRFALVATVAADGAASSIEIQPVNDVSTCFANGVSRTRLPAPPSAPYPLTIEVAVAP